MDAANAPRPASWTGRADHGWAVRPRHTALGESLMDLKGQVAPHFTGKIVRIEAALPDLPSDDSLLGDAFAFCRGGDLHGHEVALLVLQQHRVGPLLGCLATAQLSDASWPPPAPGRGRPPTLASARVAVSC